MVNERVDARSGRPQLAATQSFVYRGAVCATARTGWPRNVGIFSARRRQREIPPDGGKRIGWLELANGYSKAERSANVNSASAAIECASDGIAAVDDTQ